jgi:hypothetical protein
MADRFYQLTVTTPANTAKAAPKSTTWTLEDAYLTTVTFIIPDGHNGFTGVRVKMSQQEIMPWSNNDWLVANAEKVEIPYNGAISASGIVVETFNTDVFDHTHYLRAIITDNAPASTATAPPLSLIPSNMLVTSPQYGSVPHVG